MGRKEIPGLINRQATRHIDKVIRGRRVCESTDESDSERAEEFLARRIEQIRQVEVFGVRPKRTWRQAATKHLTEATKASVDRDAEPLKLLDTFIGHVHLEAVQMGPLQGFMGQRKNAGRKKRTINYALQVVRHVLNLAAGENSLGLP